MSLGEVDHPAAETAPPPTLRDRLQRALATRYALGTEVGRGGMGAVYLARDLALDRPVAIKVLPPEFAAQADRRERFLRETRTTASFSHPHIVSVHAVEECDGLLCFVMSYVDGETLAQRVRRAGPLPAAEAIRVLREVAWALAYAHGRGVVHRDVKPDNILLERSTGRALVTDFGIARTDVGGLTQAGEVIGTPQYMSPEQAAGEPIDGRSDLYALGAVAFFALTGHPPFDGDSTAAILAMHLTRQAPPVASSRHDIPSRLGDAVDRLLAKEPGDRFPNGEALVDTLDAMQAAHPEVPPPIRLFQLRAATSARNALVVALVAPYLVSGARGSADRVVALVLCVTAFVAMVFPIPATLRDLARRGFRFEDLREGLLAIETEQAAVRGPIRRRRLLAAAGVLLLGLVIIAVALRLREPLPGGGFRASNTALVLMLAGVAASIAALAATLVEGRVLVALDRLPRMVWTSRAGRWLFAAANAGAPRAASASPAARAVTLAGDRGPLTVFEGLPKAEQRRLRDVATTLRELDVVDRAIGERLGRIASVLAELGVQQNRTEGNTAHSEESSALHNELSTAKAEAEGRRERIAALRDAARVELLRYKAGLASEERVRQTAQQARVQLATLGAPSPTTASRHLALFALLGALAAGPGVGAQESTRSSRVNEATLREVAVRLASRELEGRATGERGGERAARFIADRFAALGVRPLGDGASFLQRVPWETSCFVSQPTWPMRTTGQAGRSPRPSVAGRS